MSGTFTKCKDLHSEEEMLCPLQSFTFCKCYQALEQTARGGGWVTIPAGMVGVGLRDTVDSYVRFMVGLSDHKGLFQAK